MPALRRKLEGKKERDIGRLDLAYSHHICHENYSEMCSINDISSGDSRARSASVLLLATGGAVIEGKGRRKPKFVCPGSPRKSLMSLGEQVPRDEFLMLAWTTS